MCHWFSVISRKMKYFFPFSVNTSQLQKIKIDEKLNRASINELFSREPQIFTQSNGQKSLSGLMSSNNRDVLKWCIDYSKILPPHQRIFCWLMSKIPIRRKSFFVQCSLKAAYQSRQREKGFTANWNFSHQSTKYSLMWRHNFRVIYTSF